MGLAMWMMEERFLMMILMSGAFKWLVNLLAVFGEKMGHGFT